MTLTTLAGILLAVTLVFMLFLKIVEEADYGINVAGVLLFWGLAMFLIYYGAL